MNFSPVVQWSFPSSHCLSVIADHSTAVKLVFTVHYGIFHGRGCIENAGLSWGCIKDEYLGWGCTKGEMEVQAGVAPEERFRHVGLHQG